jgi:uncharacterized protein YraI
MRSLIKFLSIFVFIFGLGALVFSIPGSHLVAARQSTDSTPTDQPSPDSSYITVTYIEPIHVRAGPGSYDYPIIGDLPVGGTAPAIGKSPKGEWIEIVYPGGFRDTGWVYAANVTLTTTGPLLPIVEPPPTATPAVVPTVNPTFVAQLQTGPTSTHLPTFTAPPPLVISPYASSTSGHSRAGWVILILGVLGLFGLAASYLRNR